jgi:hypothetical protein
MIKGRHLAALERARRTVPGDDTHLGGEAHIWSLRRCLEMRTDRKAWATALDTLVRAAEDSFVASRGRALDSLAAAPVSGGPPPNARSRTGSGTLSSPRMP